MTDSSPGAEVQPGQVLAGKFRIERVLGRGGMGVVVAARHIQLDERVALKFLLPEALRNAEAVRRFEREARAAVKIKSEHVARITDVGTLDTGSPYMVMEYLDGVDLGAYLERNGPLPVAEAADYLIQACEAIAEAHSLGIIHRDLKPANLFRITRSDGSIAIKVLDFGISKVVAEAAMTQTSSMMGSPYYMSPEQMMSSKTVDGRTDVWSLGIILHELLSGKVPYEGDTIPEICAQVLQSPPPSLRAVRSDVPDEIQRIIEKCLAKSRDERFFDVADFTAALNPHAPEHSGYTVQRISRLLGHSIVASDVRVTQPSLSGDEGALPGESTLSATTLGGAAHTQLDWTPPTRRGGKLALIAVAALSVLVVGALVFSRGPNAADENAEEPAEAFEANTATPPPPSVAGARRTPNEPNEPDEPNEPNEPDEKSDIGKGAAADPVHIQAPAPSPAKPTKPNTAVAAPKTAPSPAPRAAPRPAPRPAPPPAPKAAPQPSPASDLYLDRK